MLNYSYSGFGTLAGGNVDGGRSSARFRRRRGPWAGARWTPFGRGTVAPFMALLEPYRPDVRVFPGAP